MFSCSLSDVQDFTIHRTKPCSGADIKKPLRFSKVIVVVVIIDILVIVINNILVIVIMIIVILIIGRNLALERISRSLFASAK